ncbi:unnamed protein product, partial [Gadus morhua 'NCC']
LSLIWAGLKRKSHTKPRAGHSSISLEDLSSTCGYQGRRYSCSSLEDRSSTCGYQGRRYSSISLEDRSSTCGYQGRRGMTGATGRNLERGYWGKHPSIRLKPWACSWQLRRPASQSSAQTSPTALQGSARHGSVSAAITLFSFFAFVWRRSALATGQEAKRLQSLFKQDCNDDRMLKGAVKK